MRQRSSRSRIGRAAIHVKWLETQALHKFLCDHAGMFQCDLPQWLLASHFSIMQDNPQSWPVNFVLGWTNRSRKLRNLKVRNRRQIQINKVSGIGQRGKIGHELRQDAARVVDKVAKTLRHEQRVDVPWRGLLDLL